MMQAPRDATCRSIVEMTTEWLEGALGGEERESFEAHVGRCGSCRRFVDQLEATADLTRAWASEGEISSRREDEILSLILESEVRTDTGAARGSEELGGCGSKPNIEPLREWSDGGACLGMNEVMARAYLEDRLPDRQHFAVLEHLIEGCESCRRVCMQIAFPELDDKLAPRVSMAPGLPPPELESQYETELARLGETVGAGDQEVQLSPGVDPGAFVLWLIQRARLLAESEPSKSVLVASIVSELAEDLDVEHRARAAMLQGVVLRKVEGNFSASDRYFATARKLARRTSEPDLLEAKVLNLWAFSQYSRSRLREAISLYEEAMVLYWESGDIARWAECLLDITRPLEELDPASSIKSLLRASCVVDWGRDGRLAMAMSQYLALSYLLIGQSSRARIAVDMCRRRLAFLGLGRSVELRLEWTEARIWNCDCRFEEAGTKLRMIRDEFLELGLPAFAAFVSIDLSISLIGLGRWQELAAVSEPMAAFFISRGISGEAAVALGLFREALAAQTLTIAHVQALRERLE